MPSKFLAVVLAFFGVVVFQFFSGEKSALLVIDVQNCFLSGGTLEVPGGDEIVPLIKDIKEKYDWDLVVYSQDSHPPSHFSFASSHDGAKPFESLNFSYFFDKEGKAKVCKGGTGPFYDTYPEYVGKCDEGTKKISLEQMLWPDHCVSETPSFLISERLGDEERVVVNKGTLPHLDSYSSFFDNARLHETHLDSILKGKGITNIYVVGLARDYCVFYTALDGAFLGYNTFFIWDATRGISPITEKVALEKMVGSSISIIHSQHLPFLLNSSVIGSLGRWIEFFFCFLTK